MRGGNRGDEDTDDFSETMLLVVLCVLVSGLLYLRRRWVERLQRDREEQLRQQQQGGHAPLPPPPPPADLGLFPPPRDPARDARADLR